MGRPLANAPSSKDEFFSRFGCSAAVTGSLAIAPPRECYTKIHVSIGQSIQGPKESLGVLIVLPSLVPENERR
ncbi:MAG: hypothetical protein R6V12_08100, partial [Candidatus Hydrogenedentota bacterium]